VIDTVLDALTDEFAKLTTLGVLFGTLAYATKRRRVLADFARARPEIVTNLVLLLINAAIIVPLLAVPLTTGQNLLPRPASFVAFWDRLPDAVPVLAAILLIDFGSYWRHRLEHTRALWPIHATHHADEAMNWLSVRRKHPLGEALGMLIDSLPVILLGLPYWAIAAAYLLRAWWAYFIHADVPWTLGPLGKVLISPAAHRLHHIRDEQLMGTNFGNTVTLWDRIFGTYLDPAPYVNCETGIAEGTRDAWGELKRPFEARYWRKDRSGEAVAAAAEQQPAG
jgi:sterol desaturase/sphingolipid hydroxylase (fatty acid hydroxylase superfamily)